MKNFFLILILLSFILISCENKDKELKLSFTKNYHSIDVDYLIDGTVYTHGKFITIQSDGRFFMF